MGARTLGPRPRVYCLHIVGDVDGIQLVREEAVAQMHALLLAAAVNRHNAGIHHDNDADNQLVLFKHRVGHQWHQIQRFAFVTIQFYYDYEKICPCEDSAEN